MKKSLGILALVLVLIGGGFVYAQTIGSDLSEKQWDELEALWQKQQELDEELLAKMVEFGTISPERAQWMRSNWQSSRENYDGYGPCHSGPMMNQMMGGRHHRMRGRMMGGWRW